MNDQLRVVDALHDNVELVDWNAVVERHRGRRSVPTVSTSPGPGPGPWPPRSPCPSGVAPGGHGGSAATTGP